MKPKKALILFDWLLGTGFVIGMIGAYSAIALAVLGIVLILGALACHIAFYRCPHCGRYLHRSKGDFCPYCGKEINQ